MVLAQLRDDIAVGAQDCGVNAKDGAYTGEVSAHMLKDIGCTWVIIGHSERREGFEMAGEPEDLCAKKCKVALDKGLKVMFAIGEKKEERESGVTMEVCAKQLEPLAKALELTDWANGKCGVVHDFLVLNFGPYESPQLTTVDFLFFQKCNPISRDRI